MIGPQRDGNCSWQTMTSPLSTSRVSTTPLLTLSPSRDGPSLILLHKTIHSERFPSMNLLLFYGTPPFSKGEGRCGVVARYSPTLTEHPLTLTLSLLRVAAHRQRNFLLMVAMHHYYYCILTGASLVPAEGAAH